MQWYPGHMKKAEKEIKNNLKLVDKIIYVLDARIPNASRNYKLEKIFMSHNVVIVLNKKDLADERTTSKWVTKLSEQQPTVAINAIKKRGIKKLLSTIKTLNNDQKQRTRLMIVGMPNVGKSQLINALLNNGAVKTGNNPGITKGKQWVKIDNNFDLLDLPGILLPKINDELRETKLASCGLIKDSIYDSEVVAYKLLQLIIDKGTEKLKERFKLSSLDYDLYDLIAEMGKKRGCIMSGGKIDRERISNLIIKEFQQGYFGTLSLEEPE